MSELYHLNRSAEDIIAKTQKIQDEIEGLALSLQCMVVNKRPVLSLRSQLGSRRRLKLLMKDRRLQTRHIPEPSPAAE